jgi:hypothetical protein
VTNRPTSLSELNQDGRMLNCESIVISPQIS